MAFGNVAPRIGAAIDAKDLLRRRARGNHAQAAVVVDVGGLQRHARKLAHQVRFLIGQRSAGQHCERIVAVALLNALNLARQRAPARHPNRWARSRGLRRAAAGS